MRLIDADRLARNTCAFGEKKWCSNCWKIRTIFNPYTKQSISCNDIRLDFLRMIDNAKTIKSIPIKWLKDWNKKNASAWNIGYTIDYIIKDWEKENERS